MSRISAGTLKPSRQRVPGLDPGRYAPPKSVTDAAFWADADGELGAYYTPDGGFIDDPQMAARNLIAAAKRRGTEVQLREQVVAILQKNGRVQGIRLRSGSVIQSPVVVNAAGPYSGQVNALAGVTGEFRIRTRPLRQEVHSVPAPLAMREAGWVPLSRTETWAHTSDLTSAGSFSSEARSQHAMPSTG